MYLVGSCEDRRLNQSRSTAVIPGSSSLLLPGWAGREERLSRSKSYQPFRIDSDAVLHMNLIHWVGLSIDANWWSHTNPPVPRFRLPYHHLILPAMFALLSNPRHRSTKIAFHLSLIRSLITWKRNMGYHNFLTWVTMISSSINSLNSIRLMWSTASEPGLRIWGWRD